MRNPIHQEDGKWYFWEETWANRTGPFDTEEEAQNNLVKYINHFLSPRDDSKAN